jgi:hypothetical protein
VHDNGPTRETHERMHGRVHRHEEGAENHTARSHPESVVLDIGGDIGALIVHTDAGMVGAEVEISAAGQDGNRSHKDVLERRSRGRPAYTAVFDKLREGAYTLWVDDLPLEREVMVSGGAVAELHCSANPMPGPALSAYPHRS